MRILWLSNAPWVPSGYGEQTALFTQMLQADGHDVAVSCNYGLQGGAVNWNGIVCYPSDLAWGNQTLAIYADHYHADLVIALCDAWILHPDRWPDSTPPVAVWAPVDHYPIPPAVLKPLQHEKTQPVAMSRFGERMMRSAGLDPMYAPHAVDTRVFKPMPDVRDPVREELGVPQDCFLAGMVAANVGNPSIPRKGWPWAFKAFAELSNSHDDAFLYVHSHPDANASRGGLNLRKLAEQVGCREGSVSFPTDDHLALGIPREAIASLYQAFDVLLMPSMGEGFGIPLIEAQASGVPVITSDHSSMAELGGTLVGGQPWYDALQESYLFAPDTVDITGALYDAYDNRDNQNVRRKAVAFASRYDVVTVYRQYWRPIVKDAEEALAA